MEKIKKYFEFSGTISGLNYFLRNLIAIIGSFIGGYSVGYGLASQEMGLVALGFLIIAPTFWLVLLISIKEVWRYSQKMQL